MNVASHSDTPVLDREFLEIRNLILQLGAALDRVERVDLLREDDHRWQRIVEALAVLDQDRDQRAERIQMIFSRDYSPAWREQLGVQTNRVI